MNSSRTDPRKIAMVALLSAAAIASNYMLIGVANVKFMDLIVFTAGFIMGPTLGAATGVMVWLVYGTINPYGFSLPILGATMIGEAVYGVAGGLYGKGSRLSGWGIDPWAAVMGFTLTFVYDLFTNVVSAITVGIPVSVGLMTGIPFMLAHVLSNTMFFGFGFKPLSSSIKKVLGE
ncbi:MAG: hypothetical protein ABUK18_03805 [Candidatus Bathyarchaeia archaeon]